jgi:hypothetical protein
MKATPTLTYFLVILMLSTDYQTETKIDGNLSKKERSCIKQ